jgi:hypothetical protein
MRPASTYRKKASKGGLLHELLTFERLITAPLVVLIYWAGLGVIALAGFFAVGAAVGLALHNDGPAGWLLAVPALVAGLLVVAAMVVGWRALCEFYVAVFRISDDLRALRRRDEAQDALRADRPPPPAF